MATKAFTLRAETDIVHKLDGLAGSLDRSRNYEYLETHTWQVEKITQGIAAADRGELVGLAGAFEQKLTLWVNKINQFIKKQ